MCTPIKKATHLITAECLQWIYHVFFPHNDARKRLSCKVKLENSIIVGMNPPSFFLFIFPSPPVSPDRDPPKNRLKPPNWCWFSILFHRQHPESQRVQLQLHTRWQLNWLHRGRVRGICSLSTPLLVGLSHTLKFRWTSYQTNLFSLNRRPD